MKFYIVVLILIFFADVSTASDKASVFKNFVKPKKSVCILKFNPGSSKLTKLHKKALNEVSKKINSENFQKNTIRIEGYSDGNDSSEGHKLSFERSRVVENYLLKVNPLSKDYFLTGFDKHLSERGLNGVVEIVVYDDKIDIRSRKVDELVTNLSDLKVNND